MKTLKITGQFKKDLKRYKHQTSKIDALEVVLNKLKNEEEIQQEYNPHPLTGNYKGLVECHIAGDLLLIWLDPNSNTTYLVRFGSH